MAELAVCDPTGTFPACKNALGTWTCERCGQDVRTAQGACLTVPVEQRWRFGKGRRSTVEIPYRELLNASRERIKFLPLAIEACVLVAFLIRDEGAHIEFSVWRDLYRQVLCLEMTVLER